MTLWVIGITVALFVGGVAWLLCSYWSLISKRKTVEKLEKPIDKEDGKL